MQVTSLKAYLAQSGMTMKKFGDIIEYNPHYLRQVDTGKVIPSHRLARDIWKATNGIVQLQTKPRKNRNDKQKDTENE